MKKLIYIIVILGYATSVNAQWVPLGGALGGDIERLIVFNSNIYAGGSASIFRSTNNGINWSSQMPIPANAWYVAASGSYIYAGIWSGTMNNPEGVYRSTNNGLNFTIVGLNNKPVFDLVGDSQQLIAIALDFGEFKVFRSTNMGVNWINIMGNLNLGVTELALSGNKIYAGGQGLHVTTNNGVNWNNLFIIDNVESILANDTLIIIGTYSKGVYRSTNYGQSWQRTLNLNKRIYSVYQYGQNILAGADTGFYVSTNNGIDFEDKTQGLGNALISSILVHNNYVFVSNARYLSSNVSAWRRPLAEIIGISQIGSTVPDHFSLNQNYPNPFNPTTKIRFEIPLSRGVDAIGGRGVLTQLIIYDILGRKVTTLVNEKLQPGTYEVDFDGSNYPSGVYFYKIQSGDFTAIKKMVLLK